MRKVLTILLVLTMMLGIAACNTGNPGSTDTTGGADTSGTSSSDTAEPTPDLPDVKYDGYKFRIVGGNNVIREDQTGGIVDTAIWRANQSVMALFDIEFEVIEADWMDQQFLETLILSGDNELDQAIMQDCLTGTMGLSGYFADVNAMPNVDTTKPWWPQRIVESLTLNGKMYGFSNYTNFSSMAGTEATFFNIDLLKNRDIELPYDYVKNNEWTVEKLTEIVRSIYSDENGNSERDTEDIFGFVVGFSTYRWLESFGVEVYKKTDAMNSSELTLDVDSDRVVRLVDKLHNLFYAGHDGVWRMRDDVAVAHSMFANGQVAFTFAPVGVLAPKIAETTMDFGICPIPKADETQAHYYDGLNAGLCSIPYNAPDLARTGAIIEAMAYEGYKRILPAYATTMLKIRYTTNEESKEMLDLVFANQVLSFSYLFVNVVPNGMQWTLLASTMESNDVPSFYAANVERELLTMKRISDFYGK
ncbi:MAG: extracellular solute-binding protein [Clostridia bacterium]|nr:extracellular solute-binding protein [Clostridia bacterium]